MREAIPRIDQLLLTLTLLLLLLLLQLLLPVIQPTGGWDINILVMHHMSAGSLRPARVTSLHYAWALLIYRQVPKNGAPASFLAIMNLCVYKLTPPPPAE